MEVVDGVFIPFDKHQGSPNSMDQHEQNGNHPGYAMNIKC